MTVPLLSPPLHKPKKPLPLIIVFLPTSFFTLVFLFLAYNSIGHLCLAARPAFPVAAKPRPPSVILPSAELHLQGVPFPSPKSSRWSKRMKSQFKFLKPNAKSKLFAARSAQFFDSGCKDRFFMTWISSSLVSFGWREILAVESVFRFHPEACLLIVSDSMDSGRGARLLKPFKESGFRIAAFSPDFAYLFHNTPAEQWFRQLLRGVVEPGDVSLGQNISNLLRLAVLYKFGGVYVDTDVLILKSLSELKNVIGAQTLNEKGDWSRLNNAVLVFDEGHPLVHQFMEEFAATFDGNKWGHNGPYLVSRVVARMAGISAGFQFSVLPPQAFYPVGWNRIEGLFRRPAGGRHSRWVALKAERIQQESFALHLWNRQSREARVEEGSVIGRLIKGCCLFCNSSSSTQV